MNSSLYEQRGEFFHAGELTRGPWDAQAQHGGPPAAILMRAFEAADDEADLRITRVTYELVRPVPLGDLHVETSLIRPGRRVQLLEGSISTPGGVEVMRARALKVAPYRAVDGTDRATYQAIRGLDAFDNVCAGVRAAAATAVPVGLRVTLQRANYRQLPQFVQLARELGAHQVSFLPVDVANPHAFARQDDFTSDLALQPHDLPVLADLLDDLEREHASEFRSGLIADSPRKLRRIHQYFSAVCGLGDYPPVRCNVF